MPDRGLSVSGMTAQAGPFSLGPISLQIRPDRVLVVLGPSGAGKTMLLETIAGLRPQRSGRITLAGADVTGLPPERRRIGLVFQDAALFPHLTVRDNITFGPKATGALRPLAADVLMSQLGVDRLADRSPRSLSGGERQRVALARALAIQPALLLLDEPLSALDQPTREDMRGLLQRLLSDLDIPAAHVTHDRDEALSIGDDLAVIVGGQIRQAGPARHVVAEPADPDVARLVGWTELGRGVAADGTARIGQLALANPARPGLRGRIRAFYRPEDVELDKPGTPGGGSLTAPVTEVLRTRPLARISLSSDPPVAALMLHRDVERLHLEPGETVQVTLPPGCLRIFEDQ